MLKNRLVEVERSYHLRVQELVEEKERLGSEIERSKSSYADQLAFIRTNYASELGNERLAKALEELQVKFMREKSDVEAQWKEKASKTKTKAKALALALSVYTWPSTYIL